MFHITKEFEFAAAHHLTKYKGSCENPHGHNYKLFVTVSGPLNQDDLVIDFGDLKAIVKQQVLRHLDHTNLNDKFENPSCELIAQWIYQAVRPHLPKQVQLEYVQLFETSTSSVTYSE